MCYLSKRIRRAGGMLSPSVCSKVRQFLLDRTYLTSNCMRFGAKVWESLNAHAVLDGKRDFAVRLLYPTKP